MCIRYLWSKFGILLAVCFVIGSTSISAQTLYRFGQSVQPIFEGFERNSDGTFTMWFGYLNRNYDETPNIVIGDNNTFLAADGVDSAGPLDPSLFLADPGPADRGQPTYFYPRRQQFVFGVVVPADFLGKELVWSVSHNGETRTAVGTLERENIWSVDEGVWSANRGRGTGGRTEVEYANAVPEVRLVGLEGQLNTGVGIPTSLRVFASDDGISGSVIAYADRISPLSNGVSHWSFCSCVPTRSSTSMFPVSGAEQLRLSEAIGFFPNSVAIYA